MFAWTFSLHSAAHLWVWHICRAVSWISKHKKKSLKTVECMIMIGCMISRLRLPRWLHSPQARVCIGVCACVCVLAYVCVVCLLQVRPIAYFFLVMSKFFTSLFKMFNEDIAKQNFFLSIYKLNINCAPRLRLVVSFLQTAIALWKRRTVEIIWPFVCVCVYKCVMLCCMLCTAFVSLHMKTNIVFMAKTHSMLVVVAAAAGDATVAS